MKEKEERSICAHNSVSIHLSGIFLENIRLFHEHFSSRWSILISSHWSLMTNSDLFKNSFEERLLNWNFNSWSFWFSYLIRFQTKQHFSLTFQFQKNIFLAYRFSYETNEYGRCQAPSTTRDLHQKQFCLDRFVTFLKGNAHLSSVAFIRWLIFNWSLSNCRCLLLYAFMSSYRTACILCKFTEQ